MPLALSPVRKRRHALCAVFLFFPLWLHAQSETEEIYDLPEFRVVEQSTRSYTATNSLTGTQLNTALKDSPFSIEVFTNAFIEDTGATDFREVLAYDSGLQLENTISANEFGNYTLGIETDPRSINNAETDIVTRGFRAPTLKNGFFTQTRVDTANIGRIERAAGPMSLLYGIGAITGITNVMTKDPLNEFRHRAELMLGSNDLFRVALDTTGPLIRAADSPHQLAYRLSASAQDDEELFPDTQNEVRFVSPAVAYSFGRGTRLKLEAEYGTRLEAGNGPRDAPDSRAGVPRESNGTPSGLRLTGEAATFLEDYLGLGRFVNLGGPDPRDDERVFTVSGEFTQQIGEHVRFLAAFTRDDYENDRRFYAISPTLNTFQGQTSLWYGFADSLEERVTDQVRFSLLYSVEAFGGQHNFVAGRQELSENRTDDFYQSSDQLISDGLYQSIAADGSSPRYDGTSVGAQYHDERWAWYQGHYLIYQGSWWDNRILPVLGYRWDRTQTRWLRAPYEEDGTLGEWFDPLADRNTLNGYANGGKPFRQETPTAGLSVVLHPSLTVYGLYSEGVSLPNVAQRDGYGEGFPPEFTRNRELGLKFDFEKPLWGRIPGRLSGRLTYFDLSKKGGVRYSFYAPAPYRENFDPSQPIVYAFPTNTPDDLERLQRFLRFIGSVNPDGSIRIPSDITRTEETTSGGTRILFNVPFGDPAAPGAYNPEINASEGGYGQDLLAYNRAQWELEQSGETGYAVSYLGGNNPGEDRGSYHNFDEQSEGFEFRLNYDPIPNWQHIVSYTYTKVTVTSTFSNLAANSIMTGLEPVFYALGLDSFADPTDPNSYTGSLGAGVSNNDSPEHALTYWSKYEFVDGFLEGLEVGMGLRYQSERSAESPWGNATGRFVDAVDRGNGEAVKAPVPEVTFFDFMIGYRWSWRDLEWALRLNIRNVFDEDELRASSTNRLVEGNPIETVFYVEPRDVRVSLRVDF